MCAHKFLVNMVKYAGTYGTTTYRLVLIPNLYQCTQCGLRNIER